MRIKYIVNGLLAMVMTMSSCQKPEELVRVENELTNQLVIKGFLAENSRVEYSTDIDMENGSVTVKVPYYISDTEAIQGDLTQMKVSAELPIGAKFSPSLTGIHDLVAGFTSTLIYEDNRRVPLTFKAEYLKSDQSSISKVELTKYKATVRIVQPKTEGENGKILIFTTLSSFNRENLKDAKIQFSPWATIEPDIYDPSTGLIDLSELPTVTVVAQNGVDKISYETAFEYPEIIPNGVGYIYSLFGFQVYKDDTHGFGMDENKTMAIVGDYLILSNSNDFNNMPVYNRFNGEKLDVSVNCTGVDPTRSIRAITTDDAGHLVAMSFTSTKGQIGWYEKTDPTVYVWVWKDGINNPPIQVMAEEFTGPVFAGAPMNPGNEIFIGTAIYVKGNMISGKAVLTTCSPYSGRPVFIRFNDGHLQDKAEVDPRAGGWGYSDPSKVIPLNLESPYNFITTCGNSNNVVSYVPAEGVDITFSKPTVHYWMNSANTYGSPKGIDYIEFNGACLLAVQNDESQWGNGKNRLYVADITKSPNVNSLITGFIFDTLEGNTFGNGDVPGGIPGTGWSATGYQNPFASFVAGKEVFGSNSYCTGDVAFARSEDGNSVQVYMMSTNQGVLAYELTRFKLN